jgi:cytidylate kinase
MSTDLSIDRLVGAMGRAQSHWQSPLWESRQRLQTQPTTPALTIALDRETGTPGSKLACALGQRLGWVVYDQELLEKIAQEMGLRTRLLESVDEKHANIIREAVRELLQAVSSIVSVSESQYVHHLLETLLTLSAHGECIIVGRGAAQVLPRSTTLRVRLAAPLKARIAAVSEQLGIPAKRAERRIHDNDRDRELFIRGNFHRDPEDLRQYDLVLNTSRWTVEHCVDLIVDALQHFQEQAHRSDRQVWEEQEMGIVAS